MRGPPPELVDPFRLARRRARIRSAVPLATMTRLEALLRDVTGSAEVDLRFGLAAAGAPRLEGSIGLLASVTCQRCLGPLALRLRRAVKVSFTGGDGALEKAESAAGYEPLDCKGTMELATLIEDEILLALPDFPMHPRDACPAARGAQAHAPEAAGRGLDHLPFSGLRALRTRIEQSRT